MADGLSDIRSDSLLLRAAPDGWRPFLRLARVDRPIGTWLLLLPGWWSIAMASEGWPSLWYLLLFAIGALAMRGAGCTFNDLVDRRYDAEVGRTANRPLPSGEVSPRQAWLFLGLLCLIGLVVLLQFNGFTVGLGIASLALVAAYPFMKRITDWPQAWLGLTFNWGALLGWAAVDGELAAPAFALYFGGLFWTLAYDTIYAHQDKEDDVLIGVRSTALRLGAETKKVLAGFFVLSIALFTVAGFATDLGVPYLVAIVLVALHAGWQLFFVDLDDPESCLKTFRSNRDFALILFAGIVASQIF